MFGKGIIMADENRYPEREDEISLVDLLAVLIRFRRMIIGGTALVAVLAVGVLYVLPALGATEGPEETYTTEATVIIPALPDSLSERVSLNVSGIVRSSLASPRAVGNAYKALDDPQCPPIPPDQSDEEYLSMVRNKIIDERLTVAWNKDTAVLTVSFSCTSSETSKQYIDRLMDEIGSQLAPVVSSQVAVAVESVQDSLQSVRATIASAVSEAAATTAGSTENVLSYLQAEEPAALQSLADLTTQLERLRGISEKPESLYGMAGSPITTVETESNRLVMVVVATIAAFFVFVLIAFVRQAARNVAQDPEEMGKLKAAWRGKDPTSGG
jgi:hypothetical protein